jgi:glycosyltransferase involved in cell wall biosynthesis
MPPLPISVCLISGAEARRIRGALESVSGWTRELIVVLNEEVADGTDRIAAEYGAQVNREPWKGHIAQKNSALDKATQPWVLCLDADEAVSPALRDEIRRVLAREDQSPRYAAFSLPRCNWFAGRWIRHGDWYPDRKVRLWRRGQARWGGTDPHDKAVVSGRIGRLHQDLLHRSMESFDHLLQKTLAYTDEFARQARQKPRRVSLAELWVRPLWRFVRGYFLRLGFLDGWQGYSIAWLTAFYTFLRYAKVREAATRDRSES